jgi:hypothetical protein
MPEAHDSRGRRERSRSCLRRVPRAVRPAALRGRATKPTDPSPSAVVGRGSRVLAEKNGRWARRARTFSPAVSTRCSWGDLWGAASMCSGSHGGPTATSRCASPTSAGGLRPEEVVAPISAAVFVPEPRGPAVTSP